MLDGVDDDDDESDEEDDEETPKKVMDFQLSLIWMHKLLIWYPEFLYATNVLLAF